MTSDPAVTGKRSKLIAERETLQKKFKALTQQMDQLRKRADEVRSELHRLDLIEVIDVPDAVKHGRWFFQSELEGTGTLIEVRRTLATVDFKGKLWDIPIDHVELVHKSTE